MLKGKYIIFIVFGLLLLALIFLFLKPKKVSQPAVSASGSTQVLMTEKGFEPEKITIKVGTKVIFINKDKEYRWPASDLHPTHTIYPQFDPKRPIKPGDSWEFIFDKVGNWNYHDHLSPLTTGKIVVNE